MNKYKHKNYKTAQQIQKGVFFFFKMCQQNVFILYILQPEAEEDEANSTRCQLRNLSVIPHLLPLKLDYANCNVVPESIAWISPTRQ